MPEPGDVNGWVAEAVEDARTLCSTVKAAAEAGVPDALLLPALLDVFREQGMLPDMDFGSILGMFR
jgi:hypothetical protein